ncbi:fimbrial protein [Scandinavium sp. H11S7]|uniref:fimbrial protein n=1 Tax=Scandinavium hiltneri TaxID=2926519 RepID=UPI0021668026|nr:fimbrial protein [Scandinavium hiltneri]MCS2158544.1 fimbrial protein [Scandinavium hiltneri]
MTNLLAVRNLPLLLAISGLSVLSVSAARATESHCTFVSGSGTQLVSLGSLGGVNVKATVSTPTQIGNVVGYQAGNAKSQCVDVSNNGSRVLWTRFNPATATAGTITSAQGKKTPLITTSVPGIAYTLALVSSSGITVDARTATSADWNEEGQYEVGQLNGATWRYVVKLYQLPGFKLGSASAVTLRSENIQSLLLGTPTLDAGSSLNLQSSPASLTAPLISPTCQTATLAPGSHVSGNELQLGDYYMSELKLGQSAKAVPFALSFTGCAGTTKITVKLSSNTVSVNNPQLLSQSGVGASGFGVKIEGIDGAMTLIPNDVQSSYSKSDAAMPDDRQLDFNAYLMADGGPMASGAFKTTATFNLSYE